MCAALSYLERSLICLNPTAKRLFQIMEHKSSNLALAIDVTSTQELIEMADQLGSYLCVLKTHVDILSDFSPSSFRQLTHLAQKHHFLLFEDRKFADIGNTVKLQYEGGIYHISSWADIVNAHILPGPGIIEGLKTVGHPLGRGLLLLAEMSSKGSLATGAYTEAAIKMALEYSDFVIGFISQQKLAADPRFIHMTPGIHLAKSGDKLGQNYTSPEEAISKKGSDIIIVGRGITEASNPIQEAQFYQKSGWEAYQMRLFFNE
jgi:uridine monophosphate synthetase